LAAEALAGEGVDVRDLTRLARFAKQARSRLVECADWAMLLNKVPGMKADAGLKTVGIHCNTAWVEAYEGRSMTHSCVLEMAVQRTSSGAAN
jgi:hypothetical protein